MSDNKKKILYLVRGCPGSGKTTFANTLSNGEYPVLAADDYHYDDEGNYNWDPKNLHKAHKYCKDKTHEKMKEEYDKIFVCNTFVKESELKPYYVLANKMGYDVFSVVVENRHGNKNIHGVPNDTIKRMKDKFSIKLVEDDFGNEDQTNNE